MAIKAPLSSKFRTESELASFLNEARHAAALDREGIVPIYDVLVEESGMTIIVMKFVDGRSLARVCRDESLSLDRAVQFLIRIAESVHFAHESGFVHRDLKPANVLIDEEGKPWVADLGLGLCLNGGSGPFDVNGGTPAYMSPEQVRRDIPAIDRRSDIWSLGVMLAELVHGQRPFPHSDRAELFRAITSGEPDIKSSRTTHDLDVIIRQCLAKSPDDRISTAQILAKKLSLWLRSHYPTGLAKWKYGWRRTVALLSVAIIAFSSFAYVHIHGRYMSGVDAIKQLSVTPDGQVPGIVSRIRQLDLTKREIDEYGQWNFANMWRRNLTTLAIEGPRPEAKVELCSVICLMEPTEISATVDTLHLVGRGSELIEPIVSKIQEKLHEPRAVLRLGAALVRLDANHAIWNEITDDVINALVAVPNVSESGWIEFFSSSSNPAFTQVLADILSQDSKSSNERQEAARCLVRFAKQDAEAIVSSIALADWQTLPILAVGIARHERPVEHLLRKNLTTAYAQLRRNDYRDGAQPTVENTIANIAIVAWLAGIYEPLFETLQDSSDPTLRSVVIAELSRQPFRVDTILKALDSIRYSSDSYASATKFGLLQVLAQTKQPLNTREAAAIIDNFWMHDPDPGVHSSVKLVARRKGIALSEVEEGDHGGWISASIGGQPQDFVLLSPGTSVLGRFEEETTPEFLCPWRSHSRVFELMIAISTTEVTEEQYSAVCNRTCLNPDNVPPTTAATGLTLNQAYEFCNLLSIQAGLEPCYERTSQSKNLLVQKKNALQLSGYRLPTDAEWERACRCNTLTSRSFGNAHAQVGEYAWTADNAERAVIENRDQTARPVGLKLPNRWGLFDMYGNALEMCDESVAPDELASISDRLALENVFERHVSPTDARQQL